MTYNFISKEYKRYIVLNNGNKENFRIGSIGIKSYANSIDIEYNKEDDIVNLQIGNYSSIGYRVLALLNRNHDYKSISTSPEFYGPNKKIKQKGQILIGNDVWIGDNVILLSGVRIGNGAVVGAGAVVSKDIPPYAIAVGNPIRIIGYRFTKEQIKKLQYVKWWNWAIEEVEEKKEFFLKEIDEFIGCFYKTVNEPENIYMEKNKLGILFIPDFDDPYPIWRKIIREYIMKYTKNDNITLILRIENCLDFNSKINMISELILDKQNSPDILILNNPIENERSIFKGMDYFITTRCKNTIMYAEMADEFGVKILSGVNVPVFDF